MRFNKWLRDYDKEVKPIINESNKRRGGHPYLKFEEELLRHYLTYRTVRATWILVIITVLIGLLSAIINLFGLLSR